MKHPKKDQKEKRVLRALGNHVSPTKKLTKRQRRAQQTRRDQPKRLTQKGIDALYGVY